MAKTGVIPPSVEVWLTVAPKTQPKLELALMAVKEGPMMPADTAAQLRELIRKGTFGIGVFETSDCRGTYEELKSRGVEFTGEPKKETWGTFVVFKDSEGNSFVLGSR